MSALKLYLTELHMREGSGHEHVATMRWRNPSGGKCGSSTVKEMVRWLEDGSVRAFVRYGERDVQVGVVEQTPPFLRSFEDRAWNDDLLTLPRY
jgi:Protein of unknown function (DUF3892)